MKTRFGMGMICLLALAAAVTGRALADGYYKVTPQFHMYPDPNAARYSISRFGPVGLGLELRRPNFTIHIVNVEPGSPAAACGKLKKGQIIESINGSHYNAGGGIDVWIDGDHLKHQRRGWATIPAGSGRNSWRPWGVTIDNDRRKHFEDGKILLACNGFLRWGHRFNAIKCYKSFWFEEMKLPPIPVAKSTDEKGDE